MSPRHVRGGSHGVYECFGLCTHTRLYVAAGGGPGGVCTPNDSALHGQDSCFMSMGAHKLHSLAFLLQQHGTDLFAPALPLRGLPLRHRHTFLPLLPAVAFLFDIVVVVHH